VGCWARSLTPGVPGATIRLQSLHARLGNFPGLDFVISNGHSGSGNWEYLCGVGTAHLSKGEMFSARVKLEVPGGAVMEFDDVRVEDLDEVDGDWDCGVVIQDPSFRVRDSGTFTHWYVEGSGHVTQTSSGVQVDSQAGEAWVSQVVGLLERYSFYRAGCWARTTSQGATIRLQSLNALDGNVAGLDFVIGGGHSGSGEWEYIWNVGRPSNKEDLLFDARVKLQVASGSAAEFRGIAVDLVGAANDSLEVL
jgi:hypothetical protein